MSQKFDMDGTGFHVSSIASDDPWSALPYVMLLLPILGFLLS